MSNPQPEKETDGAGKDGSGDRAGRENDSVRNQTADMYFAAAKKFSDNRRWQAALELYQNISKINPVYPELNVRITKTNLEIENQRFFEEAAGHISMGQYEQGIAALAKIADTSVYYPEADQMKGDSEKKISKAAKKRKQENVAKAQAADDQKATKAINKGLSHYADGKTNAALTTLDRVLSSSSRANSKIKKRAKSLKSKVKNSQYLYLRGKKEYEEGEFVKASNTMNQLLKVDQQLLGDKRSYLAKSLGRKMADQYGEEAMAAYTEGEFPKAYTYSKMALKLKQDHSKALGIQKMLVEKSKQLYQDGYILEEYNPEKAMEKWKQILKICPPGSDYYKKALVKIGKK